MMESVLTFFICYSSAHLTNQRSADPASQPMRALPAPPLRRNSCGHLAPVSRRPAPVVLATEGACHLGKQIVNTEVHMVGFVKPLCASECLHPPLLISERTSFLRAGVEEEEEGESMFQDWFALTLFPAPRKAEPACRLPLPNHEWHDSAVVQLDCSQL